MPTSLQRNQTNHRSQIAASKARLTAKLGGMPADCYKGARRAGCPHYDICPAVKNVREPAYCELPDDEAGVQAYTTPDTDSWLFALHAEIRPVSPDWMAVLGPPGHGEDITERVKGRGWLGVGR